MYFRPVLVLVLVSRVLFSDSDHQFIAFVNGGYDLSNQYYTIGDAAINCGSVGNSTALDGREWISDATSKFLYGKSRTSTAAEKSFSIDPVPYKTSRISTTEFSYTFGVNPDGAESLTVDPESLKYSFSAIKIATNKFSVDNRIGEGGFGPVYKGTLPNGQVIAVKRLSRRSTQGAEQFKNEIAVLAKLRHRNLVRLLGFCFKGVEKILVYEFVPNKSLDYFLFDPEKQRLLDWSRRYNIIEGIARGLLYLHQDSPLRIIHRDLKAVNILLDENMNAKIADFGMARICKADQSEENTSIIAGTLGYMAPEYAMQGLFSEKSDVFSFGVLVLQIVSGKNKISFYQGHGADNLLSYARRQWRDGTPLSLLDPSVGDSYARNEVIQSIHIGLLCVQDDAQQRPTMASVVLMLSSHSVTLPTPNLAAFYDPTRTQNSPREPLDSDDTTSTKSVPGPFINEFSITEP